jgi:hypothetical protein
MKEIEMPSQEIGTLDRKIRGRERKGVGNTLENT